MTKLLNPHSGAALELNKIKLQNQLTNTASSNTVKRQQLHDASREISDLIKAADDLDKQFTAKTEWTNGADGTRIGTVDPSFQANAEIHVDNCKRFFDRLNAAGIITAV